MCVVYLALQNNTFENMFNIIQRSAKVFSLSLLQNGIETQNIREINERLIKTSFLNKPRVLKSRQKHDLCL